MKSINPATGLDYRQRICRAMNFISANLGRDPTLEEIARAANFSAFHFHRIFKAVIGNRPCEKGPPEGGPFLRFSFGVRRLACPT